MAVQYIVTPEEMQSLLEQLELKALRDKNIGMREAVPEFAKTPEQMYAAITGSAHRSFHYVVARWAQEIGFKGYRS